MTLHYHGTPISPITALYELAGRCFCVSFARPEDIARAHAIGQSVLLDNGAYSLWRRGAATDWPGYYAWADEWLDHPTTWAVIPDVIDASELEQDRLLAQWPHGGRGAPVWHMNESLERLVRLTEGWPRVCVGSTAQYAIPLSDPWRRRMDAAWNALARAHRRLPWVHMLRGMRCAGGPWPFASLDSSDVARNHNRLHNGPGKMAARWDAAQCRPTWHVVAEQRELIECM
jgi:hypothetical protein